MKVIKVKRVYCEPLSLYQKAQTKSQRALLGYMAKCGYLRDPIYGGAFKLVKAIEGYAGVYVLETEEDARTTMEIINIAEDVMLGKWDDFAFSEREINTIQIQFGILQGKGAKGK